MSTELIAILVILALVFIFYYWYINKTNDEVPMAGYWIGVPSFLESADLGSIKLFIAPKSNSAGYLIMTNKNNEFIFNDVITLHFLKKEVEIKNVSDSFPMPKKMKYKFSIHNGSLLLYDKQEIYAMLYKDNLASSFAIETYIKE
jgi:hypothetical protein